jgi:hypothetical protein
MDMPDGTLVMVTTKSIGANLTNDEKRAHLIDLKRQHLIDQVAFRRLCRLKEIDLANDQSPKPRAFGKSG